MSHERTGPEELRIVLDRMWSEVLPTLMPQADVEGYGPEWRAMCASRAEGRPRWPQRRPRRQRGPWGLGGRGAGGGRRCGRGPGDGVVGLGVGGVTGVGGRGSGEACRARMGRDANARHAPASFRRRAALSEPGAPRGARRT